ncbi:MAG TPA: DUF971 domain-containing protein [Pirellulaceae bacterium]
MTTEFVPVGLSRPRASVIRIAWNQGSARDYTARELRDHCPCATCRETHGPAPNPPGLLPILSAGELQPLDIEVMRPVGNYAYAIEFTDGHKNGIFTMELLRQLGSDVVESESSDSTTDNPLRGRP